MSDVKRWKGPELYHSRADWVAASNYDALAAENAALRERCKEHEQFRHQHRDCDAMGVENQSLRARLAEAEARHQRVMAVIRLFCAKYTPDLLAEFDAVVTDSAAHREDESHD